MSITADFHVHSAFSGDSTAPMEEQIRSAVSRGIRHLCFTEHVDFNYPVDLLMKYENVDHNIFLLDMEAYRSVFQELKEKYSDVISLYFGVELGMQPGLECIIGDFLKENCDLDFVIGSTHVAYGRDPYYPGFFSSENEKEGLRRFFSASLENVQKFDFFDTYAHLDYAVRYMPSHAAAYDWNDYADLIDPLLDILIERNKALEINTSQLGKGFSEMNPCSGILKRYIEKGGRKVTIGSDAHFPEKIALGFDKAESLLREYGIDGYYIFKERKPVRYPI